ncbi:MAG: helix-turn-helix transcriptional regulator [Clostridium sp.]|uniref:helix-turn-helix domain-containing protein n=1 Tax=Clostridium sp. TaxID=1506 RepID=UPI002903DB65|nr:helix-turn-helix transcriptional regulator [Clostridium sp.]MDU2674232.1 helix-turn-helix transcriptional regulator [Clostridium sp.]MDU2680327.1 helix-turn-helix transcriptional regulator [Clostridium sp.]
MSVNFQERVNLGMQLKVNRVRKGYTVKELSKKSGVSTSAINYWETGKGTDMRLDVIIRLAEALNISLEELIVERRILV